MLLLLLTPICLFTVCWLLWGTSGPAEPSVKPVSVPSGYKAISDLYYGYSIPRGYTQQVQWTDQNGDWFYGTRGSFVAESLSAKTTRPSGHETPPPAFKSAALDVPSPLTLGAPQVIKVHGADIGYLYRASRPGGWKATVVQVWSATSGPRMWLMIHGSPTMTQAVVASIRGTST